MNSDIPTRNLSRRQRRAERDIAWQRRAMRPHDDNGPHEEADAMDGAQLGWYGPNGQPAEDAPPRLAEAVAVGSANIDEAFAGLLVELYRAGLVRLGDHPRKIPISLGDDRYDIWIQERD